MAFHVLRTLVVLVAGVASACSSNDSQEPSFGADDMKAVAVGDFVGSLSTDAQPTTLRLHLEHAPPGSAPACSSRALSMSVQCDEVTTLGLKGIITTGDGSYVDAPLAGTFLVGGLELTAGDLSLSLPQGASLRATYASGKFTACELRNGPSTRSCSIAR